MAELAAINKVIASVSQKLDAIDAEAKGILQAASHSNAAPIQAKLDDINSRRYRAVIAGVTAARKSLSLASWINLRTFINNDFRNTTQVLK